MSESAAERQKRLPSWAVLLVIAVAAGLLIGLTNELTRDRIAQQQAEREQADRQALMPQADEFLAVNTEGSALRNCYEAASGGSTVGYVAQVATNGFGGEIVVTVGMNVNGELTGIRVGGENFSETAGLGAKTKEAAFTDPFSRKTPPLTLGKDVDAVTGATISSSAVTNAVNAAAEYMRGLMK